MTTVERQKRYLGQKVEERHILSGIVRAGRLGESEKVGRSGIARGGSLGAA